MKGSSWHTFIFPYLHTFSLVFYFILLLIQKEINFLSRKLDLR